MNKQRLLFITVIYLALGFINIHFALLGLLCMGIPIYLLLKHRKKTWCQRYCPRACVYTKTGKLKPYPNMSSPKFFISGPMKWIMLGYFGMNLVVMILSTMMVGMGKAEPMSHLRFLFILQLPSLPQLVAMQSTQWLLHLAYRFYSMMMTTTALGFALALIFKPRTWCTICPIATVSDVYMKSAKASGSAN